jgi:hypothetical protein
VVVTYNQHLFDSQWATVQNDLAHALTQLAQLRQALQNRAAGLAQGGVKPTVESVQQKCRHLLRGLGPAQVFGLNWCNPAYVDGRLYVRDGIKATGNLYCVQLLP